MSWLRGNQIEIRVIDAIGSHTSGAGLFGRVIDSGAIHPESVRLSTEGELSWDKDDATGMTYVSRTIYLAPFRPLRVVRPRRVLAQLPARQRPRARKRRLQSGPQSEPSHGHDVMQE